MSIYKETPAKRMTACKHCGMNQVVVLTEDPSWRCPYCKDLNTWQILSTGPSSGGAIAQVCTACISVCRLDPLNRYKKFDRDAPISAGTCDICGKFSTVISPEDAGWPVFRKSEA